MTASWALNPGRRRNMQANTRRDTKPELRLRSELYRRGLRFRVCHRPLASARYTADVVFTRARVAVFVDGCYWHGCPEHYKEPRTNTGYWAPKIARNRERDALVDGLLLLEGWTVIRVWEHEPVEDIADRVEAAVRAA
ncbi:very short patch repair endonuclease [Angustibacter luteus]|uniref:Very short patch repair endonuclease n=1 Tax=Angustibacter luteus TaxID=658456 RepID=A0ABW1JDV2_9ACTN